MADSEGNATPLQLDDPIFDPVVAKYHSDLLALTKRARAGQMNEREFERRVSALALAMLVAIYLLGGGDPDSAKGKAFLEPLRQIHKESAKKLAADVFDGRYSANTTSQPNAPAQTAEADNKLFNRLVLWTAVLGMIYHKARLLIDSQSREIWRLGVAEHCDTCLNLDGVVLTRAEWDTLGIDPQSTRLQCGGYHCKCRREPTDRPSVGLGNVVLVGAR